MRNVKGTCMSAARLVKLRKAWLAWSILPTKRCTLTTSMKKWRKKVNLQLIAVGTVFVYNLVVPARNQSFFYMSHLVFDISYRAEEVAVRHLLSVWSYIGHCCSKDTQDERTSLCCVSRYRQCHECPEIHARISILWQAHGMHLYRLTCRRSAQIKRIFLKFFVPWIRMMVGVL